MQARLRPRGPRIAAWCALIVPACLCAFVTCAAATGIGSLRPARVIFEPIATRGALSALRGGADDAKDEGVRYQRKLQRSYSQNSVMPVADHPTNILASTSSFDRKGEKRLDLQMVTSRLENTIEVVVRSRYGGNIIKEGTSDLVMHWGVQQEEDPANVDIEQLGAWSRPPKEMLPPGTKFRFQKESVHTNFVLNDAGEAQVKLSVPDHLAPRKIKFIVFRKDKGETGAAFWFKSHGEGEFEVYVCPDAWRLDIENKRKAAKGGLVESIFGRKTAKKPAVVERIPSETTEDQIDPAPVPEEPWHFNKEKAKATPPKMQRSASAEIREKIEREFNERVAGVVARRKKGRKHVRLNVMMPLDLHKWNVQSIERRLRRLKEMGVHGVMADMWWGLIEGEPGKYDWSFYRQVVEAAERVGIDVEFVMSFHMCGGNVGDNVYIPLPKWVMNEARGRGMDRCFYTDRRGKANPEYISLGADETERFAGRTPVQIYHDFMLAFANEFHPWFHTILSKVQIGMGPAGELRYPSFPLSEWGYPGSGDFVCFDTHMKAMWKQHCEKVLHKNEWANRFPDHSHYNTPPEESNFFRGEYKSEYGRAFLTWYAQVLLEHGDRVLTRAAEVFKPYQMEISGKVAGLHWLYTTPQHAIECTGGYYNTNGNDAYLAIAKIFKKHGATFDFTCFEIKTGRDDCPPYFSDPEALVYQVRRATQQAGVKLAGENALPVDNWEAYDMILAKSKYLDSFCFLRFTEALTDPNNEFRKFVHYLSKVQRPLPQSA